MLSAISCFVQNYEIQKFNILRKSFISLWEYLCTMIELSIILSIHFYRYLPIKISFIVTKSMPHFSIYLKKPGRGIFEANIKMHQSNNTFPVRCAAHVFAFLQRKELLPVNASRRHAYLLFEKREMEICHLSNFSISLVRYRVHGVSPLT